MISPTSWLSFLSLKKSYINQKLSSTPFLYYNHKPQKGTLLSTFSKSALLIQYNEFISKNEKSKRMKNSLNSCLSVKNHGPLLPYSQKNKQINNISDTIIRYLIKLEKIEICTKKEYAIHIAYPK